MHTLGNGKVYSLMDACFTGGDVFASETLYGLSLGTVPEPGEGLPANHVVLSQVPSLKAPNSSGPRGSCGRLTGRISSEDEPGTFQNYIKGG